MKNILKKIFYFLLFAFVAIQFFRPEKNNAKIATLTAINTKFAVPTNVDTILKASCYDCHSNYTEYPWYSNVQPVAWWLANHVKDGKAEINFDEFATYSPRRQYRKFEEISKEIEEDEMPLNSYTIIHEDAKLTKEQKDILSAWVSTCRDSMRVHYPLDSLERKKKL
jgi:Haem-binding domain